MATLYVRNIPDELYEKFKALAARRRRSVTAEVAALMENAVDHAQADQRQLDILERMAEFRRSHPLPPGAQDSVDMIREDRDR